MSEVCLATRRFTMEDQRAFAAVSGDINPMHLDTLAARRTQAGVPVVHGINAMLWALDTMLAQGTELLSSNVSAQFERFLPVDTEISLWTKRVPTGVRLELRQADTRLINITLRTEGAKTQPINLRSDSAGVPPPVTPAELAFEDTIAMTGKMALKHGEVLYPHLAARVGDLRVRGLVALSTLVGMVVPGLHSIFSSLDVTVNDERYEALSYQVIDAHDVFRLLDIAVAGPGFAGRAKAFVRLPPVVQPSMAELRGKITAGCCADVSAFVVGGSRGLGEVTAKLLATGGARLAISYVSGRDDAEAVAEDIRSAGGECTLLRYDACAEPGAQLANLPFAPNHLYYFATSKIFLQKANVFTASVQADFNRVYVEGFANLCVALSERHDLLAFYPSTVAIDERPRAMTEYTMAKAAAEILCADMTRFMPRMRTLVRRLPRLLTDQTATVTPSENPSAADVMSEVVLAMMATHAKT